MTKLYDLLKEGVAFTVALIVANKLYWEWKRDRAIIDHYSGEQVIEYCDF